MGGGSDSGRGWRRPRWVVCIRSAFYERDAFSRAASGLRARQERAPSQRALSYRSQSGSHSVFDSTVLTRLSLEGLSNAPSPTQRTPTSRMMQIATKKWNEIRKCLACTRRESLVVVFFFFHAINVGISCIIFIRSTGGL